LKNRKKTIEKIVLGVLTFTLILYISFVLIFISVFNISEKFLNKNDVTEFINSINITDIFKDKLGNELIEFTQIQEDLLDIGITTEGIEEFINSEDVKEFGIDVVTNVFNKVSDKNNADYKITASQINELLENNINKLKTNSNISEEQILNKIQNKISSLALNINELLDKLFNKLENSHEFKMYQNYIYSAVSLLDILYSGFVKLLISFVIISIVALLIFIRRDIYKSLKWISLSFLLPSVFLGIVSTFIYSFINTNNILISNIIRIINKDLIKYSIIYVLISFVFITLNIIIYVIKKYKKKVSHE